MTNDKNGKCLGVLPSEWEELAAAICLSRVLAGSFGSHMGVAALAPNNRKDKRNK